MISPYKTVVKGE